jgi:inner membrane protein
MDSLTHIVIGAAIGELTLGKKLGNKAPIYAAFMSTIPDLDVLVTPFLNPVLSLFFHRGFSHSIFFILFVTIIAGYILSIVEKKYNIERKYWFLFSLLPILSHIFIDCFNTYGTGILEPFSDVRVAYDSMAIIDFIFLLPLSIAVILTLFLQRQNRFRHTITWIGIGVSVIYFCFTIINKINIEKKVKDQLFAQNIKFSKLLTTPVPLSNFLWLIVAENETGYNIGYFCNFDKAKEIKFRYLPRNQELLGNLVETEEVKDIIRFTKGFYTVERDSIKNLYIYDLRYGSLDFESEKAYVFTFQIKETPTGVEVSRSHPNRSINGKTITNYFRRILSNN